MKRSKGRVRKTLKKYFIPHEENDHRPHILRARTVAFVLAIAFVAEGAFVFGTSYLAPASRLFGIILTNALVDGTNQNREANSMPALTVSPLLQAAAQEKANDMAVNNYFAHTSPSGLSPWYWFERVGYNFTYAGENLAVNFSDSADVTNAWMNSPEHRANILNVNFTQIGMATATGTYNGHPAVYVVELFGAPAPAAPAAEAPFVPINVAAAAGPKNETFVAVAGAESGTVALTTTTTSATAVATATVPIAAAAGTFSSESNPIQKVAANPRQIVDYLYLFIIALFALALGINVFIRIRIQHPQAIFAGMLVILIAGLFIVLNQHMLAGAAIL